MKQISLLLLLTAMSFAAVTDQDWTDLKGSHAVSLACAYDTNSSTLYMGGGLGGTVDNAAPNAIFKKVGDFNGHP